MNKKNKRLDGRILWIDKNIGNGIIVDHQENEFYFDVSTCEMLFENLARNQFVSFEVIKLNTLNVARNILIKTKTFRLGYVQWFDDLSGVGQVFCPHDQKSYYVHWSAIKHGVSGCKTLSKNDPVKFKLYENLYMSQIESIEVLKFNYTIEHEHYLNDLMNDCFEHGSEFVFHLSDVYYKEENSLIDNLPGT